MTDALDLTGRLGLLNLLLEWEGRLNNGRLRALFGLSVVRASEWIREFREHSPDAVTWNSKTRSFHVNKGFYRTGRRSGKAGEAAAESLSRYLSLVGLPRLVDGSAGARVTWSAFPDLSSPAPRVFSALSEAAASRRGVRIGYRSMREPKEHQRTIFPHNLVRAGRRWHVRAYCEDNQDFRDFALGRITGIDLLAESAVMGEEEDAAWMARVPVSLVAHPKLAPEQQGLIRFEYLNNTASRTETCRGALVSYFIQDVRAATDTSSQVPPEYQLAVENIEEIKAWLFPTRPAGR